MISNISLLTAAPVPAEGGSVFIMLAQLVPLLLVFVAMYFIFIRPQKKKEKSVQEMRKAIQIGDEVTTAGGIVGIVVKLTEDTVVVETGGDRSKIRVKKWAIQSNETIHDSVEG